MTGDSIARLLEVLIQDVKEAKREAASSREEIRRDLHTLRSEMRVDMKQVEEKLNKLDSWVKGSGGPAILALQEQRKQWTALVWKVVGTVIAAAVLGIFGYAIIGMGIGQ